MTFGHRVVSVLKLDARTFEEIESDTTANGQALAVVVIGSVAAGVGAFFLLGPFGLIRETLVGLIGWVMWAGVTWVIGTKLMPEPETRSDMGELLRVIGFSYAPYIFAVFSYVPFVGPVVRTVIAFWLLATTVIAVRQALDYRSTWRAIAVVLIGWLFFVVITEVFGRSA